MAEDPGQARGRGLLGRVHRRLPVAGVPQGAQEGIAKYHFRGEPQRQRDEGRSAHTGTDLRDVHAVSPWALSSFWSHQ
jgi:hypothetical protein